MTHLRKPWVIALLSSLASFAAVFVLFSVLDQQEKNTKRIEKTRDDVVVARKKVVGSDSELARTVRRLSRAIRKLDRERREQDALIRDLRRAGVRLPNVVNGSRGPTGLPGRRGPGPTAQQIQAAVRSYCRTNACGLTPTQAQVDAAVRACSAAGGCRGPVGRDGKDAPPITQGQIEAAVSEYCSSRDNCRGPASDPPPLMPCVQVDPMLGYQCVEPTKQPDPPPPDPLPLP